MGMMPPSARPLHARSADPPAPARHSSSDGRATWPPVARDRWLRTHDVVLPAHGQRGAEPRDPPCHSRCVATHPASWTHARCRATRSCAPTTIPRVRRAHRRAARRRRSATQLQPRARCDGHPAEHGRHLWSPRSARADRALGRGGPSVHQPRSVGRQLERRDHAARSELRLSRRGHLGPRAGDRAVRSRRWASLRLRDHARRRCAGRDRVQ